MNDPNSLHQQTRHWLTGVGWHADRAVDTERWKAELVVDGFPPLHSAALQFLAEFGGLVVPDGGSGVTRSRESLAFDPTACIGESDRFIDFGQRVGHDVAPIGELAGDTHACAFLGIDEEAEIYVVDGGLRTFGHMPQAMDHLVLGYMPRDIV